jgi:hypothetical protein
VVSSQPERFSVTAAHAMPVFNGRDLTPAVPRTGLWALLYAQVTQADGKSQRNVLLDRRRLIRLGAHLGSHGKPKLPFTLWARADVEVLLDHLGLSPGSPLSVLVVETLPELGQLEDPLGGDLGAVRILRTSPLTALPAVC